MDWTKVRPLHKNLFVKRKPPETELKGFLIVLPEEQYYRNKSCIVVSMSRAVQKMYPELSPGDEILVWEGDGIQLDPICDPLLIEITHDMVLCKVEHE